MQVPVSTRPSAQRGLHLFSTPILWLLLLLLSATARPLLAQTQLWGMTAGGGQFAGVILHLDTDGSNFAYDPFPGTLGPVYCHLLQASNGKLYGMTLNGGSSSRGTLFEYDPAGSAYSVLHEFDGTNGAYPFGSLIESGGKFYGMTNEGGSSDRGTLFEYDPAGGGAYSVLHEFDGTNGGYPLGSLIESGGKFYGMTNEGGSSDRGTLFEYDPAGGGAYSVLHEFDGTNGGYPYGSLIESGGKFYGMTAYGGSSDRGTLFEYDPAGSVYSVLHEFDGTNGGYPLGSLTESGGKFYGMTNSGGSSDRGTLFEYDPAGSGMHSVLHEFNGTNGGYPNGSLIESGGKFYGMTNAGGSSDRGTLFEYDPAGSGTHSVLHSFDNTNGGYPYGSLIESGGKFYGMTSFGGSSDAGTLFKYDPVGGTHEVSVHFNIFPKSKNPFGNLIESGGKFYGMTDKGGSSDRGTLFEYDPAGGGTYSVLHEFDNTNGSNPKGSLIESGGKFYGMTYQGGVNAVGVIFEYDPAGGGTYSILHEFDGFNGGNPFGSLIESGGKFYGMTSKGRSLNAGVIFEYDLAGGGTYRILHEFDGFNGAIPSGSLIVSGGKFYGMTSYGGSSDRGTLFEYDPVGGGTHSVLHKFGGTKGNRPFGDLVEFGGKFYGMTNQGGSSDRGTLFEYNPAGGGTYSVLHEFDGTNGSNPSGSLIVSGGKFYGMTPEGGSSGAGTIFEYDPAGSGTYSVLKHLDGANGAFPAGSLIAVGVSGCTAPSFTACPVASVTADTDAGECSAVVNYTATADGGATLTYQFSGATTGSGSGTGSGSAFEKGTTTVTVTAHNGCGTVTCIFDVTVSDKERPKISGCLSNILLNTSINGGAGCAVALNYIPPIFSDNCDGIGEATLSSGPAPGTSLNVSGSPYTVVYTKTDAAGNAVQTDCSFTVTVRDNTPPSITCPANIARNTDANQCTALVNYAAPTVSDNCTGWTLTRTGGLASGSAFPKGTNMVSWKATDLGGNEAICQFTVTVQDNIPPSITCPANIVRNTDAGLCSAVVTYATPTATDNCGTVTVARTSAPNTASGSQFPKGATAVTWEASDASSPASTKSCSFTVTVNDAQAPSIACPSNIVKNTDAGQCHAAATYAMPTATDNCITVSVAIQSGLPSGSDFPKGVNMVTWKATDAAGLTKTCTFRVTVNDTEKPVITCPTVPPATTAPTSCVSAPVNYPTPTATDNCTPTPTVVRLSGPAPNSAFPQGNTTVIWRAIDDSGRSSTCSFAVAVTDATPPSITCPADMAATGSGNPCTVVVGYAAPTATDNCGLQSVFLLSGQPSGASFPAGTTNVVWRAVDSGGNSASCSFAVTVSCGPSPWGLMNDELGTMNQNDTRHSSFITHHLSFNLSPNPATSEVRISVENLGDAGGELRVLDAQGRLMWQQAVEVGQRQWLLDLDGRWQSGVYFVTLRSGGEVTTKRLVVSRM